MNKEIRKSGSRTFVAAALQAAVEPGLEPGGLGCSIAVNDEILTPFRKCERIPRG